MVLQDPTLRCERAIIEYNQVVSCRADLSPNPRIDVMGQKGASLQGGNLPCACYLHTQERREDQAACERLQQPRLRGRSEGLSREMGGSRHRPVPRNQAALWIGPVAHVVDARPAFSTDAVHGIACRDVPQRTLADCGVAMAASLVQMSWNRTLPSAKACLVRQLQGACTTCGAATVARAATTGAGTAATGAGSTISPGVPSITIPG